MTDEPPTHSPPLEPAAPPAAAPPVRRIRFLPLLGASFAILARHAVPLCLLGLVANLPFFVISSGLLPDEWMAWLSPWLGRMQVGLGLALTNIAVGAATFGVFMHLRGTKVSAGRIVTVGLGRLGSALPVALAVTLLQAASFAVHGIPGAFVMCLFFVAVPAAIIEREGVWGALARSFTLTGGNRWRIFGALFSMGLVELALVWAVKQADGASGYTGRIVNSTPGLIGLHAVDVFTTAWMAVVVVVAYHELRVIKDGVDIDELTRVFD